MAFPTQVDAVDLMISFPSGDATGHYDKVRSLTKDADSASMEFPAEYLFRNVANHLPEGADPIAVTIGEMDLCGVALGMINADGEHTERALEQHPDRFVTCIEVDPNDITGEVRRIRQAKEELDIKAVASFPAGCNPQVPISDRRYYPIFQTCIDLDLPMLLNTGVPGPRVPGGLSGRHALRSGLLRLPRAAGRDAAGRRAVGGDGGQAHAQVAGAALHDERVRTPVLPLRRDRLRQLPRGRTR